MLPPAAFPLTHLLPFSSLPLLHKHVTNFDFNFNFDREYPPEVPQSYTYTAVRNTLGQGIEGPQGKGGFAATRLLSAVCFLV